MTNNQSKRKKRFSLTRRKLSTEEANEKIQILFQSLSVEHENVMYWSQRIGKQLEQIDTFILMSDGISTPEEAIELSKDLQEYIHRKIYEDYGRFVEVKNRLF
jgi:hypothetical protein